MEAAWAKAAKREEEHAAKMAAKEERARAAQALLAQGQAKKPKHEKKIRSSAEQRQQRMRHALPGEEEDEEEERVRVDVARLDGTTVMYAVALEEILAFLQDHEQEAALDEVQRAVGIDLLQREGAVLEMLQAHPRIEAISMGSGMMRLRYSPPFGVRNRGSLEHAVSRADPHVGDMEPGAPRPILRSELKPDETYAAVEVDLDELLAQRRAARVEMSINQEHVPGEGARRAAQTRDFLVFAMPPGQPASDEVRELWRAERVPAGADALEAELVRRKLRTTAEITRRKERKKAERKAAEERRRAEEGGKKGRSIQVRDTWKNQHILQAEAEEAAVKKEAAA